MNNKIHILRETVESKKPKLINEAIKIFKSKPLDNDKTRDPKNPGKYINKGPGYWIYIAPDAVVGNDYKDEALKMSSILSLAADKKASFMKENPGVGRLNYYKNPETGQFGWGYFIDGVVEKNPSLQEKMLDWLKGLVRKYNIQNGLEDDVKTGELTIDQVGIIQDLESSIEEASVMNPETKAKLEEYLDELTEAVENDEIFEFLTKKYSEAKQFIHNNVRAGTTETHPYTISNTFIIRAADPQAILAAQKGFWTGRGYKVKEGASGISIRFPRNSGTRGTAKAIQKSPEAFDSYKKQHGFDQGASFSDVMKSNPDKHQVGMAYSSISNKLVRTSFSKKETENFGIVFTDTMVEPIPGKEVMSIEQMIDTGSDAPIQDPFHIPQKELDSGAHIEKLNTLFRAVIEIAERNKVNIHGMGFKSGDINEFNKIMNAIAFDRAVKKLSTSMGIKGKVTPEVEEMIHGYSEAIVNIVTRHYGLPSEESKYNVARQGVDREEMQKVYSEVIRISHSIVADIDSIINSQQMTLNEVRKMVRTILRKNL